MTRRALCVLLFAIGLSGCGGCSDNGGADPDAPGTMTIDAPGTMAVDADIDGIIIPDPDGGTRECFIALCESGRLTECGDCMDNDGDLNVDDRDRECLGPCDNTEGPALEPGVGGVGSASCGVDCFFDFGVGDGNDGCKWDHRCDMEEPRAPPFGACPYEAGMGGGAPTVAECNAWFNGTYMTFNTCDQICGPLTPNACDCFGCCTFQNAQPVGEPDGPRNIYIGAFIGNEGSCTFADIRDPTKCPTCTPVQACYNTCERCEVCIGHPPPPDDCTPTQQCPGGEQACGLPDQPPCPAGAFCVTGCCQMGIP